MSPPHDLTAAVSLKIPPFWTAEPALWFFQVESQFALRNITQSLTKYYYVIQALPAEVMLEIRDIISNPSLTASIDPYATLKAALISRVTETESKRLQQLLSSAELGDRTPSQFLRYLLGLLGDKAPTFDRDILRHLFISRMPPQAQQILAAFKGISLEQLAEAADNIVELAPSPISAVTSNHIAPPHTPAPSTNSISQDLLAGINAIQAQLSLLTTQITKLTFSMQQQRSRSPRSLHPSPSRNTSSPAAQNSSYCFYHNKFGQNAKKCTTPCSYPGNERTQH